MAEHLTVVHVTTASRAVAPGIAAAVDGISRATAGTAGVSIGVVGLLPRGDDWPTGGDGGLVRTRLAILGPRVLSYSPDAARCLASLAPHVVHQHGLWQAPGVAASRFCRRADLPFVLSPHGMLTEAGLASHRLRKTAAWIACQRAVATTAALIHATSEGEMRGLREVGLRNPVAVIPLGVEAAAECPVRVAVAERHALFLGRLDPRKGVGDLVEAWGAVRPRSWRLTIAGPDHRGYGSRLRLAVEAHGLGDVVHVRGPAWGPERDALLRAADLLVLPSYSENFGLVVAEALGHGIPVITTEHTPWRGLADEGCGWITAAGVAGVSAALAEACGSDHDTLLGMGRRGWRLVRSRFRWDVVGRQFADVYRWLRGGEACPPCVHLA